MLEKNLRYYIEYMYYLSFTIFEAIKLNGIFISYRPNNHWTDFDKILYRNFTKICRHIPDLFKTGQSQAL